MADLSAGWVLNGKAVAQEALAARTLLARGSGRGPAAEILQELISVRAQLARLVSNAPAQEQADAQKASSRLTEREQELSRRLGQLGGTGREDPWVDLAEVRKRVPADAVLIELMKVHVRDLHSKRPDQAWGKPHYAAWVIPRQGEGPVRLLDLGEAQPIDDAVREFRLAMQDAPATIPRVGRSGAEKAVMRPLSSLSRSLLRPLAEHADGASQWIISPDADLWLVPWAALPLDDGRYALEKHRISYAVSGRGLVEDGATSDRRPVVMADPDYDLGAHEALEETRQILAGKDVATRSGRLPRDVSPLRWGRLPGSAREVEAVAPRLAKFGKAEPEIYTGRRALEGVFKALDRPRALVLSTHGFFLEDQDYANAPAQAPWQDRGVQVAPRRRPGQGKPRAKARPIENPLLRCGLVLAGANRRERADSSEIDDGLLTGLEIVATDLRGADLVVLSACETGLGDVRNGEGVAGLRQAFQLAGARTVVSTLWKIPDEETAELMAQYFDHLAEGWSKSDALRRAQLAHIETQRERHGVAHPLFWAGFTLTGDPGVGRKEEAPPPADAPQAEPPRSWALWPVLVSAGGMAALVGGGLLARRLRRPRAGRPAAEPAEPSPPIGGPGGAAPQGRLIADAIDPEFRVDCACGLRLGVKKEWIGRLVRCPGCGASMQVRAG
jgi:CHAT domain-containing protein